MKRAGADGAGQGGAVERPAGLVKPPYVAVLVVEASRELSFGEKAVWRRIWALDQTGRGCYASAERLAEDLGSGARNVEKMRSRLHQLGLVVRYGKGGRSGYCWLAVLPTDATPRTEKITHAEKLRLAGELDGHIRLATMGAKPRPLETPNKDATFRPAETLNDAPGYAVDSRGETPNDWTGNEAEENPERLDAAGGGNPGGLDGVNRGNPEQSFARGYNYPVGKIAVAGKKVRKNPLTSVRRADAREVGAVADGGTAGPMAETVARVMGALQQRRSA